MKFDIGEIVIYAIPYGHLLQKFAGTDCEVIFRDGQPGMFFLGRGFDESIDYIVEFPDLSRVACFAYQLVRKGNPDAPTAETRELREEESA